MFFNCKKTIGTINRVVWLGVIVLLVWALTADAEKSATLNDTIKKSFQLQLDRFVKNSSASGALAAVQFVDGSVLTFSTGCADRACTLAMPVHARIPTGSIGKTFVAALVLDLAADNLVSLDTHIAVWLKDFSWFERLPNAKDITLRMLLNHSSGLPDHADNVDFFNAIQAVFNTENPNRDHYFTPEQLIDFVLDEPPLFAAGKGYNYSDTGYILIGLIIEKATGRKYYDLLAERILKPLQLADTTPLDHRQPQGITQGYLRAQNPFGLNGETLSNGKLTYNPATEWTGGGLISTPQDLVNWASALYQGRAFNHPYRRELFRSIPRGGDPGQRYGLGVYIDHTDLGEVYGHGGYLPGYFSLFAYHRCSQTAMVVQFNADVRSDPGYQQLRGQLLRALIPTVSDTLDNKKAQ